MKNDTHNQPKFMPQKPHGELTLPSGKKIKVGPQAVSFTKAKDTPMNLLRKLAEAGKEGIFPPSCILKMKQAAKQTPEQVIFDSNILQYIAQPKSADMLVAYITDLISRGFTYGISAITIYELLKGATKKTETKMMNLLEQISAIEIKKDVLQYAAKLDSAYKLEGIMSNEIEDGDKIIAASALLSSSILLTANARDFPSPFFKEVERQYITFEEKRDRTKTIVVYLLQPQTEITEKRIGEIFQ